MRMSKKTQSKTLAECVRRKYHRPGNGLLQTESEIAAVLGEETRTIRTWRHAGIIPAIILGHRSVRFRLDDVVKALEARTVKPV
jgi:excisionase family DNA binding protein